ncbi:hypothetical protein [Streptomyces sp. NPDC029674]|uniref:hypothetical protein n=1 Tax=Streptomyces sp. NPDC029674 TaxID=3365297 RepID=UPI00384DDB63
MSDTLPQNEPHAHLIDLVPFAAHLGIALAEAGPDRVEVYDDEGRLVGRTTQTQAVLSPPTPSP